MTKREELIIELENMKYSFGCSESAEADEENHRILKNSDSLIYMNHCPQSYNSTEYSEELCTELKRCDTEVCDQCWKNALKE